ncbi:hypothetical protein SLW70_03745 [Flavobacterium sp. NG2]|uniref:hypothetical protein n=1 Tax=Flavobacterium sp. NG2 TaxID=3097547 RepID=UPI002A8165C1|nr:hypothetical protein [Flavobacterium sp. NG2]WPR72264.1 hypothetical protein SLW70_03745 [Flavobacterium sp. NG2]
MKNILHLKLNNVRLREILFFIGFFLLVLIPKGGFKLAGVPITWGYLYLGIVFFLAIFILINKYNFSINSSHYMCYLATLPFVLFFTVHLLIFGYNGSLGNLIAFYISFVFLPFLFYLVIGYFLAKIDSKYIEKLLANGVLIVAAYGIFLFIFKQLTGSFYEIPYFTVNAGDLGELSRSKFNQRGSVSKLISTYNNGNIFGVCLLMLFPVFYKNTKSRIKIVIVILALFLTLSRTVWIGLIFYFLIQYRNRLFQLVKIYFSIGILLLILGSLLMTRYFQYGSLGGFILDPNFGGRIIQIRKFNEISLLGNSAYTIIDEIVYLSIFRQFGIVGLFLFCFSFFTPIYLFFQTRNNTYVYILGVIIYLFVCLSDGCMLLIPTLAFFYFIATMAFISQNRTQK